MVENNLTEDEIKELRACATEDDYCLVAQRIKADRGGQYPQDWYLKVLKDGGIASELKKKWNNPEAFEISVEKIAKDR